MSNVLKNTFFASLLIMLMASLAFGQRTTATLFGSVQDTSGSIMPGATVQVINELTGAKFSAITNERGEFTMTFLPVGRYTVELKQEGFKTFRQTGLALSSGQEFRYPIKMELGAINEQVTVKAEAPILENVSSTLRDTVSTTQIMELPQSRRDFTRLLSLENGVSDNSAGAYRFNGLGSSGSTITVDGTEASGDSEQSLTSFYGNFNIINVISEEAIQEVQVSKGVMSAEIARTFGGNINVITKGGTNQFHGTLFENLQNDALNARYALLAPTAKTPPVRFNQFGGSFGGPIIKDKLFFFGVYEGYRLRSYQAVTGDTFTREFKAQLLAAVPAYDLMLKYMPLPTQPYAAGAATALYSSVGTATSADDHGVVRVDYRLNDTNSLSARYTRSRPSQNLPYTQADFRQWFTSMSEVGTLNFTHSAASWTSETRFGVDLMNFVRNQTIWDAGKIPGLVVVGTSINEQGKVLGQGGHIWTLEQVFSKTHGRHSLKAGGIFERRDPGRFSDQVPAIQYPNVQALLANQPNQAIVTFQVSPFQGQNWETGLFLQDDIRLKSNLIVNLGLRYEYFSVYRERTGRFYNPDGPAGAVSSPAMFRPKDSAYDADRNNFSPRVGFAWNFGKGNKNVIRGGFGVFTGPFNIINFQQNILDNPAIPSRVTFAAADVARLGLKYPLYAVDVQKQLLGGNIGPIAYWTFEPKNRNPYNLQWTFDYQRQLTATLMFQTGYVGNHALKIVQQNTYNFPDRITGARQYPGGLEFQYQTGSDSSYYDAWQTSLRKRVSHHLSVNFNYSWSKALTYGGGDYSLQSALWYQDENNWRANKGPTVFDVTHQFVADFVYEIPLFGTLSANPVAKRVLGGWQLSGIFSDRTGLPFDVAESNSRTTQRADYIGGNPYASGNPYVYVNKAAFAKVPVSSLTGQTIRPGSVGKNSLRGPGLWTTNLSLAKSIPIAERWKLQLRADAFNGFNNVTLGQPVNDINNANFGRILTVGQARQVQVAARLQF